MPWLEKKTAKIYYETWGKDSDPLITLVNGHSRPLNDFRSMARYLENRGHRVLALDNRGAGQTEITGEFSLSDLVGDISDLWQQLGTKQSSLLGISLGGMLAMTVAARYPEKITKLVLCSTSPQSNLIKPANDEDPVHDLLRYFSPGFLEKNGLFVKALVKETAKVFQEPHSLQRSRLQRKAMQNFDASPELKRITAPTLILHGEDDRVIGIEAGKLLASLIPHAEFREFPGVGHLFLAEAPRVFYQVVSEFVLKQ